ncbi:MAG: FkbM family methyltransferase [Verrucomicrobiota bacterium]
MRRVFLDIGAHIGQTAKVVLDPKYRFDAIYCFEPVPDCAEQIRTLNDPRLQIITAGLAQESGTARISDAGGVGASIHTIKDDPSIEIQLLEASSWFQENISPEDLVFVKMNCEGTECDILDNLFDSRAIDLAHSIMVDFDVRKIPGLEHREKEIRQRIRNEHFHQICFCEDVMLGKTHADRIDNWLTFAGIFETLPKDQLIQQLFPKFKQYSLRNRLPKIVYKIRRKLHLLMTPQQKV